MELFRPGGLELTNKAAELIGLAAGDKVLDIGCGLGTSLCFLRDKFNIEAYGLDINPNTVLKAGVRLGTDRVECGDAEDLPYDATSFNAVFVECVLTLCENPGKVLSEAYRVLVDGGHLVISSLDGANELCANGRIGRGALQSELKKLGFEILYLSDEGRSLRQFMAEIIFKYDSMQNYIEEANKKLGGSILNCDVPIKNTGYALVIAKKSELNL